VSSHKKEASFRDTAERGDMAEGASPDGQVFVEQSGLDADPVKPESSAEAGEPQELRDLRVDLEEMKDRALRSQAELENYRKRIARQMEEDRRYAEMGLLRDVLPLWDNMQRAIEAAQAAGEAPALLQGFQMVARQLSDVLEKHQCVKIDALHKPFDPHLHEAITQLPSADFPPQTVLHVTQEGFTLHGRVVRPSQVVVSAGAEHPSGGNDA
jgi:molecular chaperone GrpE